ncbi:MULTISPECIES: Mor transcription activator family protein [Pseudomonas]|uniref:Mor transcription activator family protein n=1 Tax=Pseudomonas TaxID=286 RepID=UPI00119D6325|nr:MULTISPECIES: Mor transcription activator family protein [Pseudomonas]TWC21086.1 Mor family transcriptional regulator [Pseudomonas sp. SJZ075]TWC36566.1 Mor family transcriptional regulator [Pseudomonas sp. SJZ078]TWC57325.1 Mor family transcriptional regulator [Pseudomonas sp. SJZ124]TWC92378.1 Mor family transcriptional regulator [Pseudomonas sp. SJZ101]UZD92730.1 transcriptional regulator [Pseudomonas corrugata]
MTESLFPDDSDSLDPNKVLAHMEDPAVLLRWEGTLKEMVEIAEAELRAKLGERPDVPEIARFVVFAICDVMGGSVVYLPRGEALKKAMRDASIFRDWRDNNIQPSELVRKYRLASPTIYDIIARQRALHRRNEPDLFGFDERTIH